MRYLFDRASATGKYHRLVIDVDEGRYWAEVSDDRFYLPREPETESSQKKLAEAAAELERKGSQAGGDVGGGGRLRHVQGASPGLSTQGARFGAFKETTLKPVKMKNTLVMDVYTPRMADPITHGRAYIYFFPLGQTEPAIVHLSDPARQTIYSLVVHPITGRVRIVGEYVQPPLDDQIDDEGTRAP